MEIQNYLRSGNSLDSLKEIGVYFNRSSAFPNLVQLSYDQIESSSHKTNPIVQECRGLILDESNNWSVVAYPFKRFANAGEVWAADIDWSSIRVQEKVDGSLIIMYHYAGHWHVATRGSANADGQVGQWTRKILKGEETIEVPWTFRELFWSSCEYWLKGLSKSGVLNPQYTYMFELTSPLNKVVCDYTVTGFSTAAQYNEETGKYDLNPFEFEDDQTGYGHDGSRITLIGVRDIVTEMEIPVSEFSGDFHYTVKEFELGSLEEIMAAAEKLDPLKQEGYVIVDRNFNRIKVKSPKYVLIHHLRDGFGPRRLVELIQLGEDGEFLAYYPEFQEQFDTKKAAYNKLIEEMQEDWYSVNIRVGDLATQKEFALEAVKTKVPAYLFSRRKGLVTNEVEFLKNMNSEKLMELL